MVNETEQPLNTPELPPEEGQAQPAPSKPKKRRFRTSWKGIGGNGLILAFAVIVIFFIWSFVNRMFIDPPVKPETVQGGTAHTIQLDVLNGSGVPKLSQKFTDYLRARGFDVVETGNYKDSKVENTRVLDRTGHQEAAQQVAEALGVPKTAVVQQIDRNAYLDVTVVIGKDFRLLKPFK
ncbi:MAG: LytR C-terminal domain-containing protein [Ignavibacteriales bacterium]|nr:LytR C-terminal domain-containing protein [Ignavibacteriales bacterium]